MARYNEYRDYRDYDVRDRFLDESDWERRDREYGVTGSEDYYYQPRWSSRRDREYRDREYGWRPSERDWNRESRGFEGRRWAPSTSYAGGYTSGWNNEAYGGWSSETGFDRPGYGGPWSYGTRYGADYVYGGYPRVTPVALEGKHHGHGPRGWRRSDPRIEDEVHERLTRHGYLDATDIEVEVKDAEVTLKGKVRTKEEKRLAEDLVDDVLGVQDVHNKLKVNEDAGIVRGHEDTVKKVIEPR